MGEKEKLERESILWRLSRKKKKQKQRSKHHGYLTAIGVLGQAAKSVNKQIAMLNDAEYEKYLLDLKVLNEYGYRLNKEDADFWLKNRLAKTRSGAPLSKMMYWHLFNIAQVYHEARQEKSPWGL